MSRAATRSTRSSRHSRPARYRLITSPLAARAVALARGIRIVAELDLRSTARRRATWIAAGAWVAVVYGLLVLALAGTSGGATDDGAGTLVHSLIATSALAAGLAVVPALGADTLNRNRDSGLLDMLRVTQLSARAISWGVFAGTLLRVLGLVALTAPALLTGLALGGSDVSGFAWALLVLTAVPTAVAAVAQAASALFARRATALIAAYTATGVLVLGPWVAYAAALPLTTQTVSAQVRVLAGTHGTERSSGGSDGGASCVTITEERERTRPDRIWWLLAPEPFVVLADAAPGRIGGAVGFEPLSAARDALRLARIAPPPGEMLVDECPLSDTVAESPEAETGAVASADKVTGGAVGAAEATHGEATRAAIEAVPPTWPLGLAVLSLTGAAGLAVSTRRLRAPGVPAVGEHLVDSSPRDL